MLIMLIIMQYLQIKYFVAQIYYTEMSYCEKLMKMSLEELKIEYYSCDDKNTAQKDIIKQIANKKKLAKKNAKKDNKNINIDIDIILKSKQKVDNTFIKKRGHMEKCWESHKTRFGDLEPQYKEEVEKDFTNNKLMERLNCEVDFRINGNKKKEILKPYDDIEDYNSEEEAYQNSARRLVH